MIHGLQLNNRDIDHVAIGPGGVLVVETKWAPSYKWSVEGDRIVGPIRDPVRQVRDNATRVRALLGDRRRGGQVVDVHAAVIVWGPGAPEVTSGSDKLGDVLLFTGRTIDRLGEWLDEPRLDWETMQSLQALLVEFADKASAELEGRAPFRSHP